MLDLQKAFDKEQFLEEGLRFTQVWVDSWLEPSSGPSAGGRRDVRAIGVIHTGSEFILKQRRAYNEMIEFFATTMLLAHRADEREEVLRAIHHALDRIMGGSGANGLRVETLNDIFLRTMELMSTVATDPTIQGVVSLQSRRLKQTLGFGYLETKTSGEGE